MDTRLCSAALNSPIVGQWALADELHAYASFTMSGSRSLAVAHSPEHGGKFFKFLFKLAFFCFTGYDGRTRELFKPSLPSVVEYGDWRAVAPDPAIRAGREAHRLIIVWGRRGRAGMMGVGITDRLPRGNRDATTLSGGYGAART